MWNPLTGKPKKPFTMWWRRNNHILWQGLLKKTAFSLPPTPPFSKRFALIESLRLLRLSLSKGAY